ncbi:hypothetical protein FRC19_009000 [Serendipita sp. 401]|nr:hypothetical protein FRC19_009000 [Serendipita sp. 401]
MRRSLFLAPKVIKEISILPKFSQFHVFSDLTTYKPVLPTDENWSLSKMAQPETHAKRSSERSNDTLEPSSKPVASKKAFKRINTGAKKDAHRELMGQLEEDLKELIMQKGIPAQVLQARSSVRSRVERTLQRSFGTNVSVQNVGLEHIGAGVTYAPHELSIEVRGQNSSNHGLEELNSLHDLGAIVQALGKDGIDATIWEFPGWTRSGSLQPTAPSQVAISSSSLQFFLYPPSLHNSARLSLIERYTKKFTSMKDVLASLFFLLSTGTHCSLPPFTTSAVAHLLIAYYQHKYTKSVSSPASTSTGPTADAQTPVSSSPVPLPLPPHPFDILSSNRILDTSSDIESSVNPSSLPTSSSEDLRTRQRTSVAYDLLEFLKWWDDLAWDKHTIAPALPSTRLRDIDAITVSKSMPWDIRHSPLVIHDSINPTNNLAALISPIQYAEMRRVSRVLGRRLRSGMRLDLARSLSRPFFHDPSKFPLGVGYVRGYATEQRSDYGEYLTEDMDKLYKSTRPNHEVQARRQATMRNLDTAMKRFKPRFQPALFGSSRYGVGDGGSDLDVVILDRTLNEGFLPTIETKTLHPIYRLRPLADAMRSRFEKIIVISTAKVPIIKAQDAQTGLHLDVNINDRLGLYNTQLLSHYCELWPSLSNLIYVVKKWAKARGLNDPAGQLRGGPTFSSYCLTLMVTHGILPNLQDSKYANDLRRLEEENGENPPRTFWIRHSASAREQIDVYWYPLPVDQWQPLNDPSLGRAFYSWLLYFGHDHKYDEFALRVAEGGIVPRRTKKARRVEGVKALNQGSQANPDESEAFVEGTDGDTNSNEHDEIRVEAVTNDVQLSELELARAQAEEMAAEDIEFEEAAEDYIPERKSQLDEPVGWRNSITAPPISPRPG